jgi:hypothetical protein
MSQLQSLSQDLEKYLYNLQYDPGIEFPFMQKSI